MTSLANTNDDFLYPKHQDTTQECLAVKDIYYDGVGIPLCATLSIVCYIYLFWMYFGLNSPVFKRHPTTLAIYKCLFECLFVQQYLWIPFVRSSYFYDGSFFTEPYYCNSSTAAAWWAFISQFSLLGSELWFYIISVDMRLAYTNPFTSYKHNRILFATTVTAVSLATACLLLLFGPQVYGVSELGLVWIQDRRTDGHGISPNYPKMLLYYLPSTAIYAYCIWANFQVYKSSGELSNTISNRWTIMRRSKRYTAAFVVYGLVVYLIEFISALNNRQSDHTDPAPSYFYALRGVISLMIILYSNYNELTWAEINPFRVRFNQPELVADVAKERLLLSPHLNTALRAEILYFTTQGIIFAAKEYEFRKSTRITSGAAAGAGGMGAASGGGQKVATVIEKVEDGDHRMYSFDAGGLRLQAEEHNQTRRSSVRNSLSSFSFAAGLRRTDTAAPTGGSSNNNAANTYDTNGDDGDEGFRDTITELEKLQKLQVEKISMEYDAAMREEVESLGADPRLTAASKRSVTSQFTNKPTVYNASSQANPMHEEQKQSAESISALPGVVLNSASTGRSIELTSSDGRSDGGHGSGSISSSDSTVKWGDSIDVEFGIRGSQFTDRSSAPIDTVTPAPWRRLRDAINPLPSIASDDGSSNSAIKVIKVIQSVVNNATSAAKSVFSPAFRDFRFKDFCPKLFATVRAMHNISASDYARAFETTCRERFSEGRSGAFMFYSSDQRCIVKTTTKEESLTLQSIMPTYVLHLENNPNSLLVRFLGSHCITMYGVEIYFVVMLNVFPTFTLSERYDLKGSWVNRHGFNGSRKTRQERKKREQVSAPLFQDNDLQNTISIEAEVAHALALQIRADITYLQSENFMDYSLLIGVRRERFRVLAPNGLSSMLSKASMAEPSSGSPIDRSSMLRGVDVSTYRNTEAKMSELIRPTMDDSSFVCTPVDPAEEGHHQLADPSRPWRIISKAAEDTLKRDSFGGIRADMVEGAGTYYIGIIDVLQKWNWTKRLERFFKMHFKFLDGDGLSATSPEPYARRFWKRVVLDTFEGLSDLNSDVFACNPYNTTGRTFSSGYGSSVAASEADHAELQKQVEERREQYAKALRKQQAGTGTGEEV